MFYLLKKEGLTMDDFHYEIKKLTRIRKAIPKPDENTLMQKDYRRCGQSSRYKTFKNY